MGSNMTKSHDWLAQPTTALSTLSFLARKLGYDLCNWQVELTESILGGNDVVRTTDLLSFLEMLAACLYLPCPPPDLSLLP